MKLKLLALSLGLVLAQAAGAAQNSNADKKNSSAELEKARADMDRAIERYAQLARKNASGDLQAFNYKMTPEGGMSMIGTPRVGLGIVMSPNNAAKGVVISDVSDDSPADKAGLKTGDVIVAINGSKLTKNGETAVGEAREKLGKLNTGSVVNIDYLRAGKQASAKITAGPISPVSVMGFSTKDGKTIRMAPHGKDGQNHSFVFVAPEVDVELQRIMPKMFDEKSLKQLQKIEMPFLQDAFRWNSLNLSSVDAKLGRYFGTDSGVLVISADEDMQGIEPGDVIVGAEGKAVSTPRELMRLFREKKTGEQLDLDIFRDKQKRSVKVKVPDIKPLPFAPPPPPPPGAPQAPKPPKAPAPPKVAWVDDGNVSHQFVWTSSDNNGPEIQVVEIERNTAKKSK